LYILRDTVLVRLLISKCFAGGSCKEFKPEWEALATALKRVKTAHVMIDSPEGNKLATKLGVLEAGIPNVQLYTTEKPVTLLAGDVSTAKKLRKQIFSKVKQLTKDDSGVFLKVGKGDVNIPEPDANGITELTDENFDAAMAAKPYFVKFYAPWCGQCKKLQPYFEKISAAIPEDMKAKMGIAKLDATAENCKKVSGRYDISGYPTLKVIGKSAEDGSLKAIDFELKKMKGDGKESAQMANFAAEKAKDIDKAHKAMLAMRKHEAEKEAAAITKQEEEAVNNEKNLVKRMTVKNFKQSRDEWTNAGKTVFVKFYRPDCATCRKLAPRFEAAAKQVPDVVFAHVDCIVMKEVCTDEGIPSYPVMIMYDKENMAGEWPGEVWEKDSTVKTMVKGLGGDIATLPESALALDIEMDKEIAATKAKEGKGDKKGDTKDDGADEGEL
jgi:thiol-disulfide isomerase/thioredoxin